ncbi:MAG: nicotinate-nucleotide--dimethylbenzimidazole phosphoribosyltransferase [Gammaproteobacteria bacterium]
MSPWLTEPVRTLDESAREMARARQVHLTKPPGSLGRLEALALDLAAMQGRACPRIDDPVITVFAADHGVARAGVSAFPQAVTAAMVRNFASGGAAISVLARQWQARFEVVNLGTVEPLEPLDGVTDRRLGPGTADWRVASAMTAPQFEQALRAGAQALVPALERNEAGAGDLLVGGEMGIGNSTSAAALVCALLDVDPTGVVGPGSGVDEAGMSRKVRAIRQGLGFHGASLRDPVEALRRLGGFEIAALTGAYIAAAQRGMPVLVDGFIAGSAALAAVHINPGVRDWLIFAHRSAEPGHGCILQALGARPLLDLELRLGEGSGAALALPLLHAACALHADMATFETAGVPTHE